MTTAPTLTPFTIYYMRLRVKRIWNINNNIIKLKHKIHHSVMSSVLQSSRCSQRSRLSSSGIG